MFTFVLSFTIFGSFIWFCVLTLALLVFFFYAESEEEGFIATAAIACYLIVNHFWGNVPVFTYVSWSSVGIYLGAGFIFAIIRTYMFGRKLDKLEDSYIRELKGNVFRWWFLWPVSLISWAVSDLAADVWNWVYAKVGNVFESILKAGFNSIKK